MNTDGPFTTTASVTAKAPVSAERPPRRPVARTFRRRWLGAVVVLAVTASGAAVVGGHQGPRLRAVSYSASDLVTDSGQRVILTTNQAVQPVTAADVRIAPAAAHTVTTSGNQIAVNFAGPLAYDRDYTITVARVRAPGQQARSTITTRVHTGTTSVLTLLPGAAGADDRIVSRPVGGAGNTVVYQGSGITAFARLAGDLVIVRRDAAGHSHIDLTPLSATGSGAGTVEKLTMPTRQGTVAALHVADDAASFGFVYADTSTGISRNTGLYVVDIAGTHVPLPVGANGRVQSDPTAKPLAVSQWAYVPRTERILARTADNALLLIDPAGMLAPLNLGSALYLHGFVGAGTSAVVENGQGIRRLDLTTGKTGALPEPAAARSAAYLGRIAALTTSTYLRVVGSVGADGVVKARIVRADGQRGADLPVVIPNGSSVTALCPSPNGEEAAVLTRNGTDALILIIDAASGAVEASIAGTDIDWCQALPSGPDDD